MTKEKELLKAYDMVIDVATELNARLGKLGKLATDVYGENLTADLCGGYEIEFRRNDENGFIDADDCIRLETLLEILKKDLK